MMVKIFTMKEDAFLKAVFYGQINKKDDMFVIANESFLFKIIKEEVTEDDEYILNMSWHKKEWNDDEWSTVEMVFSDDAELERKCELDMKQSGIPRNDKHGNPDQLQSIQGFWNNTIFKGLTQMGNIGCKPK